MKSGLVAVLCASTLVPLASPALAGPPHGYAPRGGNGRPYAPRYYGGSSHHHSDGDDWVAFGLGAVVGALFTAVTTPPPPPPPRYVRVYEPAPVIYAQPPSYPAPGATSQPPTQPYGWPPPSPYPAGQAPQGPQDEPVDPNGAPQGAPVPTRPAPQPMLTEPVAPDATRPPPQPMATVPVGPEPAAMAPEDPNCPGAGARRVYVPPQVCWRERRVVEPARYGLRQVPVYEEVNVPVFGEVLDCGVMKTVQVGTRLESRQVGMRQERVLVRPETVRVETVPETIPGRWAYVPAAAISDAPYAPAVR